ncbi:hypothetical protein [Actinoalloteichus hymeniacidonis]|uniref:Uncharacterized protein n=1 Tax=Actinoalloteichus hymeniacidonis TaxID=340345 RepID=A0AAC9HUW2_9PSEU|nr:hypothetical protein [Actinoalloteichus hymeniacidonis]AOS65992.1 hypothetical protein TL08_26115 [Actinoalloteichus hymeniacidonis]MBB5905906.1 hypothetical protein [Actinoalloteichus hymeniacidonis]
MDEKKLSGLFHDAVGDTPPASFDEGDVVRTSRRVTARRRMTAAGGSAFGVAVLVGGLMWGGLLPDLPGGPGTGEEMAQNGQEQQTHTVMGGNPLEESSADPRSSSLLDGQHGFQPECGQVDPALVDLLAEELPPTADEQARPVGLDCLPDSRGVSIPVRDDAGSGLLSVVVAPESADSPTAARLPDDAVNASISTADGELLTVVIESADGSTEVPHADELHELLGRLADRL